MSDPIVVGGRAFAPVDPGALPAHRDDHILTLVAEAKLDQLRAFLAHGEDAPREILLHAMRSGKKAAILAAMLDEIDGTGQPIAWTDAVQRERTAFFQHVTAPEDKAALRDQFVGVLIHFFRSGLASLPSSVTSSAPAIASPATSASHPLFSPPSPTTPPSPSTSDAPATGSVRGRRPKRRRSAPTLSAPGHPSPASSPATTTPAPVAS